MSTDPVPQRLSDAERDAAVDMLRQHYEAGRLDQGEFTERMDTALAARISSELAPLFVDLPDPRPADAAADPAPVLWTPPPPAARPPAPPWLSAIRYGIWPIAIVLGIVYGQMWLFIILALVGSAALQAYGSQHRTPPPGIDRGPDWRP